MNIFETYFDGGDCCLDDSSPYCFKGLELCIESEIGDGVCQDYNHGKVIQVCLDRFFAYQISVYFC